MRFLFGNLNFRVTLTHDAVPEHVFPGCESAAHLKPGLSTFVKRRSGNEIPERADRY